MDENLQTTDTSHAPDRLDLWDQLWCEIFLFNDF